MIACNSDGLPRPPSRDYGPILDGAKLDDLRSTMLDQLFVGWRIVEQMRQRGYLSDRDCDIRVSRILDRARSYGVLGALTDRAVTDALLVGGLTRDQQRARYPW